MDSKPNVLGIDHPIIAAEELDLICHAYERLGFQLSPRGQHPWGTANNLIMFQHDFIELLGVYDTRLLSQEVSPNSIVYSGLVRDFLARREGLALLALHSDDIDRDQDYVKANGLSNTNRIEFRRAVTLPDGRADEAVVSLVMLINEHRNLSTFICQQHKPHLVWVPAWCEHPNKADSVRGVTYVADEPDELMPYYQALYGKERVYRTFSGLEVNTPNGMITILSSAVIGSRFPEIEGLLPAPEDRPCGIAVSVHTQDLNTAMDCLVSAGVPFVKYRENTIRVGPDYAHGIVLELVGD